MVLNIRSWYWGDPSTTVLTALQFAAKFLEIMMQTSLGTILMSIVRHQLLGDRGLPLGSFLGPYSVTDISYLRSLEFWGGLGSKHARMGQRVVLGIAVAAFVVLASLVGPSIAVLLIPRPIDYTTGHYLVLLDEQATIFPSSDPESTYITFGDISPEASNLTFADLIEIINSSTADNSTVDSTYVTWSEAPQQASNHSILMVQGNLLADGEQYHENAVAKAEACVIDAIWATAALNATSDAESNLVMNFELGSQSSQISESQLIKISPDWAAKVVEVYYEYQPDLAQMPLAKIFALALAGTAPMPDIAYGPYGWRNAHNDPRFRGEEADAVSLSQAQYDAASAYFQANRGILSGQTDVFFYAAANWTDPAGLYHYEFETYRQGYGYDSSSVPVLLSLIVVAVYALIAVTHLLYTFTTGYVGRSWDTLAELLLLGLHSQPPEVNFAANTTVGIETVAPFKEPVSVRINENGRAELLFDRDALNKRRALSKIEVNEAY
ncbi:hypothetical protein Daus18300_006501 [Diaporthe australafricana]|uniref:DUF3533 domain-containing protein n=1 Tax=Diaporthe australafricana TaxID=127596 RepID=A0ABR3WUF9_9PEZI